MRFQKILNPAFAESFSFLCILLGSKKSPSTIQSGLKLNKPFYLIMYPSPEFFTTGVTIGLGRMGMAATTLELKASEAFNDLKSVDQRMLIMEMWNWYQPNSEKLMTLMATLDQVIFIFSLNLFWGILSKN